MPPPPPHQGCARSDTHSRGHIAAALARSSVMDLLLDACSQVSTRDRNETARSSGASGDAPDRGYVRLLLAPLASTGQLRVTRRRTQASPHLRRGAVSPPPPSRRPRAHRCGPSLAHTWHLLGLLIVRA